jgi:hypothetical protein
VDTFSHALWGRGLFGYRGHPWLALLFGTLPDLVSFTPLFFYRLFSGTYVPGPPALETIPDWLFISYDLMHSFVTALLVVGLVAYLNRSVAFAMLAWPFHICLDFPFHTARYFPTKIFWPLSDFHFDGISWGSPEVWFPNIAGLIVLFGWRFLQHKKTTLQMQGGLYQQQTSRIEED